MSFRVAGAGCAAADGKRRPNLAVRSPADFEIVDEDQPAKGVRDRAIDPYRLLSVPCWVYHSCIWAAHADTSEQHCEVTPGWHGANRPPSAEEVGISFRDSVRKALSSRHNIYNINCHRAASSPLWLISWEILAQASRVSLFAQRVLQYR
jgi:hypothetical protein